MKSRRGDLWSVSWSAELNENENPIGVFFCPLVAINIIYSKQQVEMLLQEEDYHIVPKKVLVNAMANLTGDEMMGDALAA